MLAHHASFAEAQSLESAPEPQLEVPAPVPNEPNRWCIDDQYHIYRDAKMLNEKMVMTRLVTIERQVLTGSLCIVPKVQNLFTRHTLEWTSCSLETHREEVVREFYASYVVTLKGSLDR